MLAFINGGEEGKALYNAFVTGRVCYEVYKRLSVSQADVLRVGYLTLLQNVFHLFSAMFLLRDIMTISVLILILYDFSTIAQVIIEMCIL